MPGTDALAFRIPEMQNGAGETITAAPHPMMELHMRLPAKCGRLALLRKIR